ncbi:MAG TPA: hypothetical protein VNZ03_20700 [Terriglobales bacterium]|nr:hypothetical protein [Terriglobales bacterium]
MSDHDEFEWEAYLIHLDALREREEELHREYLAHRISASRHRREDKYKVDLAA